MKAAILSVGTEILFGQIDNTNTTYLSQQLNHMGIDVMYHYTVGDNPERLKDMYLLALRDCDIVVTTGGLGPTQDDLTKEIACEVLGDKLVLNEEAMNHLEEYAKLRGKPMTENNRKQAYLPSRAEVFQNDAGSAPGFALEKDGRYIICMPGPPREMTRMFQKSVVPFLQNMSEGALYYQIVRCFGIGESALETELLDLIDNQTDPTLATYAKEGECQVRVASKRDSLEDAKAAVTEMIGRVQERVGEYIYSLNDEPLVEVVARKLIERNLTVASAESCTGGMFAAAMTDVPGISQVFHRGYVTYSNEAKMDILGVKAETLEEFGAVSEQTAREMVCGLAKVSGADVCVSVTGIAGPGGGSAQKPVGLVYVGFKHKDNVQVVRYQSAMASREWNRSHSLLMMLDIINRNL